MESEIILPEVTETAIARDEYAPGETDEAYHARIWEKIQTQMAESSQARSREEPDWEEWGRLYMGDDWAGKRSLFGGTQEQSTYGLGFDGDEETSSLKRLKVNKTQTAITSNAAGETKEPLAFRWEPVEAGHPELIYLRPRATRRIQQHVAQTATMTVEQAWEAQGGDPLMATPDLVQKAAQAQQAHMSAQMGFTPEQLSGMKPLTEDQGHFDLIDDLIQAGVIGDEDVIRVSDVSDAEVAQTIWDVLAERAFADQHILVNIILRLIFGHQWIRFQWHDKGPRKNTFSLENTHILNVWCDTTHQFVEDMDYLHFDHVMSFDEASGRFPEFRDDLERAKSQGDLQSWGGDHRRGSIYANVAGLREMVIVRTSWLRHQEVPMTEDEAEAEGLAQFIAPTPELVDAMGNVVEEGTTGGWLVNGEPATPPDEKTGKASKNWPKTTGLLQVVSLPDLNKIVDCRRNPYFDIPFGLNVNIFRPFSPYGDGEPHRLEDIENAIDTLVTILITHVKNYPYPTTYMRSSTFNALQKLGISFGLEPGQIVPVPDQDYQMMVQHGRASLSQDAPPIPEGYFKLLDMLLQLHDTVAGHVEVNQGRVPFPGASGKLVESLISEATGPLAMRSKRTEYAWERIAREAMYCVTRFMKTEDVMKIVSDMPKHVLEVVLKRLADKESNVKVETYTGRGVNRQQKQQTAMALFDRGLMDPESVLDELRWNNAKGIVKKIDERAQAAAPAQQAQMIETNSS